MVTGLGLQDLLSQQRHQGTQSWQHLPHILGPRQALQAQSWVCFPTAGLGEGEVLLDAAGGMALGALEWFPVRHERVQLKVLG